ncbi:acyl carrier protein [Kosmotoga arenicorallina S304]|uniref:Acyl carrier protein n=1 Tax=Kosmotoga arenicorallina S304 TaxID=1453497 RepID=A0A176JZD8_9BACT|nr:acyl carrier protein [Kosmotoga arenicorallina]OAA29442.1 acyl carrier protein [Kosmotoga arenicorallina S304]
MEEKVISIIAEQLGLDPDEIKHDSNFTEDLGADSLDLVDLIMKLEDEFDVKIEDDVASQLKTVGDAIEFVKKLTSEG